MNLYVCVYCPEKRVYMLWRIDIIFNYKNLFKSQRIIQVTFRIFNRSVACITEFWVPLTILSLFFKPILLVPFWRSVVKWCLDLGSDRKLLRIPKLSGFSGTSEFHLGLYWKYIIYMVEPDIASINTEPQRQQKSSTNVNDLHDMAIMILAIQSLVWCQQF